jgi:hypothetical protein
MARILILGKQHRTDVAAGVFDCDVLFRYHKAKDSIGKAGEPTEHRCTYRVGPIDLVALDTGPKRKAALLALLAVPCEQWRQMQLDGETKAVAAIASSADFNVDDESDAGVAVGAG